MPNQQHYSVRKCREHSHTNVSIHQWSVYFPNRAVSTTTTTTKTEAKKENLKTYQLSPSPIPPRPPSDTKLSSKPSPRLRGKPTLKNVNVTTGHRTEPRAEIYVDERQRERERASSSCVFVRKKMKTPPMRCSMLTSTFLCAATALICCCLFSAEYSRPENCCLRLCLSL